MKNYEKRTPDNAYTNFNTYFCRSFLFHWNKFYKTNDRNEESNYVFEEVDADVRPYVW